MCLSAIGTIAKVPHQEVSNSDLSVTVSLRVKVKVRDVVRVSDRVRFRVRGSLGVGKFCDSAL